MGLWLAGGCSFVDEVRGCVKMGRVGGAKFGGAGSVGGGNICWGDEGI
jgi:hypothetical protein